MTADHGTRIYISPRPAHFRVAVTPCVSHVHGENKKRQGLYEASYMRNQRP